MDIHTSVSQTGRANLNCRFYENEFPEVEDVVIVEVKQIADMGAYVQLLEYNNTEGARPFRFHPGL